MKEEKIKGEKGEREGKGGKKVKRDQNGIIQINL